MRESGQGVWWRRTSQLAGGLVASIAVGSFIPALMAGPLAERTVLGMPLAFFLFALAAPVVALILIFWFVRKQLALDHRYDVTGSTD